MTGTAHRQHGMHSSYSWSIQRAMRGPGLSTTAVLGAEMQYLLKGDLFMVFKLKRLRLLIHTTFILLYLNEDLSVQAYSEEVNNRGSSFRISPL